MTEGEKILVIANPPYKVAGGSWKNTIPRIDWNRAWTDEEILKEYGFTEEEIKEIISAPDPRSNNRLFAS